MNVPSKFEVDLVSSHARLVFRCEELEAENANLKAQLTHDESLHIIINRENLSTLIHVGQECDNLETQLAKVTAERDSKERELATSVLMMAKAVMERDSLLEVVSSQGRQHTEIDCKLGAMCPWCEIAKLRIAMTLSTEIRYCHKEAISGFRWAGPIEEGEK